MRENVPTGVGIDGYIYSIPCKINCGANGVACGRVHEAKARQNSGEHDDGDVRCGSEQEV